MNSAGSADFTSATVVVAFPEHGVRLSVLERLASQIPASFTTNELCHEFVRQKTVPDDWTDVATLTDRARGYYAHGYRQRGTGLTQTRAPAGTRSYVQRLSADAKTRKLVGVATHFVSHAWKYRFADVLTALEAHVARLKASADYDGREIYLWFDICTVNEHTGVGSGWASTFKAAVGAIAHTCLVLSPWDDPVVLTRSWCLWCARPSHSVRAAPTRTRSVGRA
jgi:hypothetical protein